RSTRCLMGTGAWNPSTVTGRSSRKEVAMFDQLIVSGEMQKTHKPWAVTLSATVQTIIIGVMILIPLIYTEALPKGMLNTFLVAPAPPPPPPPPAAPVKIVRPRIFQPQTMVAPTVIPKKVEMIKDEAPDVGAGA